MAQFKPKFESLVQVFNSSVDKYADRPLFGSKKDGEWQWMRYGEFGDNVRRMRTGLANLGVQARDRVAIISNNSPAWATAAYAGYGLGASCVPMYESQNDKDWKYILRDCGAKVLFVANQEIAKRIRALRSELPDLKELVLISGQPGPGEHAFAQLLESQPSDLVDPGKDAIAGFVYTSGTTGNPKGVKLSHQNIAYNVSAIHEVFPMEPDDRSLCFLPWAHVFGQTVELHGLFSMGASMGMAEAVDKIVANLAEVKPTLLFSVPRIFNRIYDGLNQRMAEEGGLKKKLFEEALDAAQKRKALAEKGKSEGWLDLKFKTLDKIVFSKVRERFGGQLKYAFSGGAAISKEVAEFIDNLGIKVYEGYGLSETSPIATMNYPGARKIGSVGKAIPGVSIEIDIAATDDPNEGEVLIFGHNIMQGYHGLDEANAEVLIEKEGKRGFRSGDMGRLDDEGFLYITGRVKEQYKLLNGKYVVPTPLEEQLKLSPYITNAFVYGMNREFNVAVIVPDFNVAQAWAEEKGEDPSPEALSESPAFREVVEAEVRKYSAGFKGYEKVKNFHIAIEDFTTENDMLTPTLKLKRRVVNEKYADQINALYIC